MILTTTKPREFVGKIGIRKHRGAKPSLEGLETRTLLSTVRASLQTFYRNDATAPLLPTVSGTANFYGTTLNDNINHVNYTDAYWTDGTIAVGDFGSVQFVTATVDERHRDYTVAIVPIVAGASLTQLSATVYGKDGFGRNLATPINIDLPDPQGSIIPIKFYAQMHPDDGSSTLDPSVLWSFMTGEQRAAVADLNTSIKDLQDSHQDLVKDAAELAASAVGISILLDGLDRSAELAEWSYFGDAFRWLDKFDLVKDLGEAIPTLFEDIFNPNVVTLQAALNRVLTDQVVAETLAAKTLMPTRIVVNGVSDDFGLGAITLGGPGQRYRNDFIFDGPAGHTSGISEFYGFDGQLLTSGAISTQNYYDVNGDLLGAESSLILPQGTLRRSIVDPEKPDNTYDSNGFILTSRFNATFAFSQAAPSDGAFPAGLSGYTITGDVSMEFAPDGSEAAVIAEHSPSSLTSISTVPDADEPLLVMELKWLGDLNPDEVASFTVDFTDADRNTTVLYRSEAEDSGLHGDQLSYLVVSIPHQLRGKTGALRFRLDPSDDDGVQSRVMLGGFTLASVNTVSASSDPILYGLDYDSDLSSFAIEKFSPETFEKLSSTGIVLPSESLSFGFGLAADPITQALYTVVLDADDEGFPHLARIDPATGVLTELDRIDASLFGSDYGVPPIVIDLDFDPAGNLYALSWDGVLARINPQNGTPYHSGLMRGLAGSDEAIVYAPGAGGLVQVVSGYFISPLIQVIDFDQGIVRSSTPLSGARVTGIGSLIYWQKSDLFLGEGYIEDDPTSGISTYSRFSMSADGFVTSLGSSHRSAFALAVLDPTPDQDRPPVAVIESGPYHASEGSSVTLDGSRSRSLGGSPDLNYEWDLNYDGLTFDIDVTGSKPMLTFDDNKPTRNIALRVTDSSGLTAIATTFLYVSNLKPTAVLSNSGTVDEGSAGSVSFTDQSDPSLVDQAAGFIYSYDFDDDGNFEISGTSDPTMSVPAQYFEVGPGTRTVRARISDKDGQFTDYTTTISIHGVDPRVAIGSDQSLSLGGTLNRSGSFSDPGNDVWTATVDYGDGSGIQSLSLDPNKTFDLAHAYLSAGSFVVSVTVSDSHGSVGTASFHVTVAAPPVIESLIVNDGLAQRSMVTSLTYIFSTMVSSDSGAFEVTRRGGGDIGLVLSTTTVGGKTQVVLKFTGDHILGGSLADGNYTVTVHAERIHDLSGLALGLTADRVDSVFRFFGDSNGDGAVDNLDYARFRGTFGKQRSDIGYLWYLDFNGDGVIDSATDYSGFISRRGKRLVP